MVDINIGNGQGITQAIRDKIGAANIKNKDAATWQKVVAEVNSAQKVFLSQVIIIRLIQQN